MFLIADEDMPEGVLAGDRVVVGQRLESTHAKGDVDPVQAHEQDHGLATRKPWH